MSETKLCPKTLMVEILDDGSNVINGAPCIEKRCMAWHENKDYTGYCKIIEGQP